jgi:hypothetical protein
MAVRERAGARGEYISVTDQRKMPPERPSITAKLSVGSVKIYATVGLREDGTPGELFIRANSQGSLERGLMHALALMVSVALQHDVPLEKVVEKLEHLTFEPRGLTGNADMPAASSIVDLLAKWLRKKFLTKEKDRAGS